MTLPEPLQGSADALDAATDEYLNERELSQRCLGEGVNDQQFAGSPEWDTHLVAMHRKLWDDSQTRLMNF